MCCCCGDEGDCRCGDEGGCCYCCGDKGDCCCCCGDKGDCCCCCGDDADCCEYGFFAHAFLLCFTAGFAVSREICECTIPGFSYTNAPGVIHKQCLCYYNTKSWTPVPTLPVHFCCLCNLCLCGFDFGNYRDIYPTARSETTITSAPVPQIVSRKGIEEAEADNQPANLTPKG